MTFCVGAVSFLLKQNQIFFLFYEVLSLGLKGRIHRKIGLSGNSATDKFETNLLRNVGQDAPVGQLQPNTRVYVTEVKLSKIMLGDFKTSIPRCVDTLLVICN